MYREARKIQLISEVLKVSSEDTLVELEGVLKKMPLAKIKKPNIYDFVGAISKKESAQMKQPIKETCETIEVDDWK